METHGVPVTRTEVSLRHGMVQTKTLRLHCLDFEGRGVPVDNPRALTEAIRDALA